jgi:putative ABC transport system substrate-binding protein
VTCLSRRQFVQRSLTLAGISLSASCGITRLPWQNASSETSIPRIGVLSAGGSLADTADSFAVPFRRGLADLGYAEGTSIVIEWRADEGREERLAQNVVELLALSPDVIVAAGDNRARAAKVATGSIPIVLSQGVDPVGLALIDSFPRPGGNVTGTIEGNPAVHGARLQLLREIAPEITRVMVLGSVPSTTPARLHELEVAALALGVQLQVVGVQTAEALTDALMRAAAEKRTDALLVVHSGLVYGQRAAIFEFEARTGLPTMYGTRLYAEAGGLIAYGPNLLDIHYRSATYVDKILRGAQPAELPVEQPTHFDLIINLATARALGLTIPPAVLAQATEVIP